MNWKKLVDYSTGYFTTIKISSFSGLTYILMAEHMVVEKWC